MKSSIYTTILCLVAGFVQAQAPQFNWVAQLSTNIQINASTSDAAGNLYATGFFNSTVDFDPSASTEILTAGGFGDIFVSKSDPFGNLLWVIQIGGDSYDDGKSIAIDKNGFVYVTGFYNGEATDFDPGVGTFMLDALNGTHTFVLKLDADGNFVWAKQLESLHENYGASIAIDNENHVLVTGRFQELADFDPNIGQNLLSTTVFAIYIWKLDADGNFIWAKRIETISTRSHSIATDALGNIYLTGLLTETNDFDPSAAIFNLTTTSTLGGSLFMIKLNKMGDLVWAKQIEKVDTITNAKSVVVDDSGNSYYAGDLLGTTDFDPNAGSYTVLPSLENSHFLLKLNSDGTFAWVKTLNDVKGMALDKQQNIYTCGKSLHKFNSSGILEWVSDSSLSATITIDAFGNLYATGFFYDTFDFDPDSSVHYLTNSNENGTFMLKLSPNYATGNPELVEATHEIQIYPNPTSGTFKIQTKFAGEYSLFNSLGCKVQTINPAKNELYTLETELPNGLYFLQKTKNGGRPIKIILNK